MVKAKYRITGRVHAGGGSTPIYPELENLEVIPSAKEQNFESNKYGYDKVTVKGVEIKEHYLIGTNLVLVLPDDSNLYIDISSYIVSNTGLTEEQIEAINNMTVTMTNDELIFEYDEIVLGLDFSLENGDLVVNNSVPGTDFNINQNGELEVLY